MKFSTAILAFCLALTSTAQETSLNVAQILLAYGIPTTLSIPAAESTSLASAINSVVSTWYESPQFTSLVSAIYSAAPSATAASYASSGIPYGEVATQAWFTKSVPTALQSVLQAQFSAENSAELKILGTPTNGAASTSSSKGAAGAVRTPPPMMVAGAMGVLGGVALGAM